MSIEEWLAKAEDSGSCTHAVRRQTTFAALGEKPHRDYIKREAPEPHGRRPRSLLNLPFSKETFHQICEQFQVHDSIVRALTRSDVPTFACDSVDMDGPAQSKILPGFELLATTNLPVILVYSCRSSNSWDMDLALSATHYVHQGLTFAIVYGTTFNLEKRILERLRNVRAEAAHPMLLPGIFAEVELLRHTGLVDGSINEVEAKIFELDFQSSNSPDRHRGEAERRAQSKRTAWLNLTYLRNSITTWNTQIQRMMDHVEVLNGSCSVINCSLRYPPFMELAHGRVQTEANHSLMLRDDTTYTESSRPGTKSSQLELRSDDACETVSVGGQSQEVGEAQSTNSYLSYVLSLNDYEDNSIHNKEMRHVGQRILARLSDIREDYDEKIRDCEMRVDGMAMATQWVIHSSSPQKYNTNTRSLKAKPQWRFRSLQIKIPGS
jgi:hypothetical protein